MTIKEVKNIIDVRIKKEERSLKTAVDNKNKELIDYYRGRINMLIVLRNDIALDMPAELIAAMNEIDF